METLNKSTYNELVSVIIDAINDGRLDGKEGNEIHQICFNEDYYIIGYYAAEQWLINNYGIFAAIEKIKDYEQDNFGEVSTDLSSSEKVINMLVYILGEEIINDSILIAKYWDKELTEKRLNKIKKELEGLL